MGTVSTRVAGMSPSVAGRPQGTVHSGVDTRGTAMEQRDRDSQLIGIIKPVASQPLTPHEVEEIQKLDVEFDWENETVEQWAYAKRDTITRELFQAPHTGTSQHWGDFRYRQARHTCQLVLDLRNTRHEVKSQLLSHHLYVIRSQNLNGLALEWAQDEVMQIYGRHLETEVEPFQDYL